MTQRFLLAALLPLTFSLLRADVRLPQVFSDHMVLQSGVPVKIWGWANSGEKVRVSIQGRYGLATADAGGRWQAWIGPLDPAGPVELAVQGANLITIWDVVVGEVWVASGQSNMAMALRSTADADREIATANFPKIRFFRVKTRVSETPVEDVEGAWEVCSPDTAPRFSAAAYYFAKELSQRRGVAFGILQSAVGGTPVEAWTSMRALDSDGASRVVLDLWKQVLDDYPAAEKKYQASLTAWKTKAEDAQRKGEAPPAQPRAPLGPGHTNSPAGLYNGMIAPLIPFSIRGALWYQGENNAGRGDTFYRGLFETMIRDWRSRWGQGDFPFLWVQLPNFIQRGPRSAWSEVQEAQLQSLELSRTGMAVTIDIGNPNDIHPTNKRDVGLRLAVAARHVAYQEDIVWIGPLFRQASREDDGVRLWFEAAGAALKTRDGLSVRGFELAGADGTFVPADARIEGRSIVVRNPQLEHPTAIRYAWGGNPDCNLYNSDNLPASPFRAVLDR